MGSFTLAQVAARTDVLAVACSRCERAERYPLATLIERYGRIFTVPLLLDELLKDARNGDPLSAACAVRNCRRCSLRSR